MHAFSHMLSGKCNILVVYNRKMQFSSIKVQFSNYTDMSDMITHPVPLFN